MAMMPNCLCHYYEAVIGPFRSLTRLPAEEAERILKRLIEQGDVFASQRTSDYLGIRRDLEDEVQRKFIAKGGRPEIERPHYMILGMSPWLKTWYRNGAELRLPLCSFPEATVSFTYGDTFPAMRYQDGKPYRGQVYRLAELSELIRNYGLPQVVNTDGTLGPDRYIEAQVWSDRPLERYLPASISKKQQ